MKTTSKRFKVAALKNTKAGRSYGRSLGTTIVEAASFAEAHEKAKAHFATALPGLKVTTDIVCCDCDAAGVRS